MFRSIKIFINKLKTNYKIFKNILLIRKIKPKYIFFSENKNYQKFSYLLIETIIKKYPKEVYYVSSELDDTFENSDVINFFIGKGFLLNIFFLLVRANNMFLTTTDLDNNAIKKTNNVDKYIYYFHEKNKFCHSHTDQQQPFCKKRSFWLLADTGLNCSHRKLR